MTVFRFVLIFTAFFTPFLAWADESSVLNVSSSVSTEGFNTLSWKETPHIKPSAVLEISDDPDFQNIIRRLTLHDQSQVHVSGFVDGHYYARLSGSNHWVSNTVEFRVQHRDLNDALILFVVGLILFVGLIASLLYFNRTTNRPH